MEVPIGWILGCTASLGGALYKLFLWRMGKLEDKFDKFEIEQARLKVAEDIALENRLAALELQRAAEYRKLMRVLNAMMWALKTGDCEHLDPDSLFQD